MHVTIRLAVATVLALAGATAARADVGERDAALMRRLYANAALHDIVRTHALQPVETRNVERVTATFAAAGAHCTFEAALVSGAMGENYRSATGRVTNESIACDRDLGHDATTAAAIAAVYGPRAGDALRRATLRARLVDPHPAAHEPATHAFYAAPDAPFAYETSGRRVTPVRARDLAPAIATMRACFTHGVCGDV